MTLTLKHRLVSWSIQRLCFRKSTLILKYRLLSHNSLVKRVSLWLLTFICYLVILDLFRLLTCMVSNRPRSVETSFDRYLAHLLGLLLAKCSANLNLFGLFICTFAHTCWSTALHYNVTWQVFLHIYTWNNMLVHKTTIFKPFAILQNTIIIT